MDIAALRERTKELRKTILRVTNKAKNGHVGGSLSEIDILAVLYHNVMNVDPGRPDWADRDRYIQSKGHATPGYYTALWDRGYFDLATLESFDQTGSKLQAHPDMHKCPGVDYSTGSLGQGLSVAIGIELGAQLRGKNFTTFTLIGDGEAQEGQVWEALMFAGVRKVKNLVAIFDYNKVQLSSTMADNVDIAPLADKLSAFRWNVLEVDGHDIAALDTVLRKAKTEAAAGPVAVIANTVKGKGVSFMEGQFAWHGKAPNDSELEKALEELDQGASK
ncbi:transketolase [Spirochaetia bacterium]|nr:transketolase [Spirochaetia bacterium]